MNEAYVVTSLCNLLFGHVCHLHILFCRPVFRTSGQIAQALYAIWRSPKTHKLSFLLLTLSDGVRRTVARKQWRPHGAYGRADTVAVQIGA